MVRRGFLFILTLAIGALGFAQQKGRVAPEEAQPYAEKLVTEIKWHNSLESVLADARKENKLAFYMHMLGKIDGDT